MKIFVISTAHDARDDRLYYKEARSLAKKHTVTLIAPSYTGDGIFSDDTLQYQRIESNAGKATRVLAAVKLLFSLRRGCCDVIHVADIELFPLIPLLRLRTGAKIVCDIWEANPEIILGPSEKPSILRRVLSQVWRTLERTLAGWSDLVLTADPAVAGSLGPAVKPVVIFNYPIVSLWRPSIEERTRLLEDLGGGPLIVYHGSMSEERGSVAAIEMMPHVVKTHSDAVLVFVGNAKGRIGETMRRRTKELGLEGSVRFTGWVAYETIGLYLAAADIGIIPSFRTKKMEANIPQKLFEFWATGIPVIATALPLTRRYVAACGGGVLLENNDPLSLAGAVCALLDDPTTARQMGMNGKAMVEKEWNWEKAETVLLEAYRSLGPPAPRGASLPG